MAFNVTVSTATFTRPADTTTYASGDLVANSTSATAVVPMSFTGPLSAGGAFIVRKARITKTSTTTSNATFRLHLYSSSPALVTGGIANGDNAAWSTDTSGWFGTLSIDISTNGYAFVDGAGGAGIPVIGTEIANKLSSGTTIYGLLEARGSYAPANGEVFTVSLEIVQN
jgi:hypothetical protein